MSGDPPHTSVVKNVIWGGRLGIKFGALLSVWAVAIFLIGGEGPFHSLGTNFVATIALYLAGGMAGGVVLGLFRPLIRNAFAAALVGILVALPACIMAKYTLHPGPWDGGDVTAVIVMPLCYGILVGPRLFRGIQHRRARRDREARHHHNKNNKNK